MTCIKNHEIFDPYCTFDEYVGSDGDEMTVRCSGCGATHTFDVYKDATPRNNWRLVDRPTTDGLLK